MAARFACRRKETIEPGCDPGDSGAMSDTRHQRAPRLFLPDRFEPGLPIPLGRDQTHYLTRVLRLGDGAMVRAFNGVSGEWLCRLVAHGRRHFALSPDEQLAFAAVLPDLDYLFAPLKHARLDYLAQKATEMGCRRLRPVITEHTVPDRVNTERLRANVIEAAEQCDMIALPEVLEPLPLPKVLANWEGERQLIWCDKSRALNDPLESLAQVKPGPLAVLVGPEGGFSEAERDLIRALPAAHAVGLGPRIMRADTAAVAVLALVQATLGDWRNA